MADHHDSHGGHGSTGGHGDHGSSRPSGGGKGGWQSLVSALGVVSVVVYGLWGLLTGGLTRLPAATIPARIFITPQERIEAQCDGRSYTLSLDSNPLIFNPDALCSVVFDIKDGPIELSGPFGSIVMQPGERRTDLADMWFETARAVNSHAVLYYRLVQQ